jgi:O-antigen/teichoic acid export membrane protein
MSAPQSRGAKSVSAPAKLAGDALTTSSDPEVGVLSSEETESRLGHVVRAFGLLAGTTVLGQVLGFVALAYVARRTDPSGLGAYSFDLTIATYFGLAANLGVSYLATRDIARSPVTAAGIVRDTLLIQGGLSLLLYALLVVAAPFITRDGQARTLLPVIGLTLPVTAFTIDWALLALRRSRTVAVCRLAGQLIYAGLVFGFIKNQDVVLRYSWFNVGGLLVTMVGVATAFLGLSGSGSRSVGVLRVSLKELARRLRRSAHFAWSLIMLQVYAAAAIPLLGYLSSTHSVGIYAIAYRMPAALIMLANVWLAVFFPYGAQRHATHPESFLRDLGRVVTVAVVLSLAAGVAATLCARDLMPALFGMKFRSSAAPFALLSWAAALVLIQATTSNALLASGNERRYSGIVTAVAIGLVLIDIAAIPAFGAIGAGIGAVLAEVAILTLTIRAVWHRLGHFHLAWRRILRGACSVALMGAATAAARTTHSAGAEVSVAFFSFLLGGIVLGAFDPGLLRSD